MKKSLLPGMHSHKFGCEKRKKGKFMCCLVFKRGLHTWKTCHLLIILFRLENIAKKQHADVRAYHVVEDTIAMLNAPNNALIGKFIHQHPLGPIIWEQTQYEHDAYYCENNIITTIIFGCANDSSPITSTTSGEAAEEYLSEYMVKKKASLKQAVPSLLAALDQIRAHPRKAEDTGSIIRSGIHLAQCTVNTFSGSHQWSMPLMASALLGNKMIISSKLFHYKLIGSWGTRAMTVAREVTRHGRTLLYSWSVSTVSLRSK
jgi:hypothetical protein